MASDEFKPIWSGEAPPDPSIHLNKTVLPESKYPPLSFLWCFFLFQLLKSTHKYWRHNIKDTNTTTRYFQSLPRKRLTRPSRISIASFSPINEPLFFIVFSPAPINNISRFCGSQNKSCIGCTPDPFFPSEYKRKKAVWQHETTKVPQLTLPFLLFYVIADKVQDQLTNMPKLTKKISVII